MLFLMKRAALVAMVALSGACGSSGPAASAGDGGVFPADPLLTVTSDSGKLRVEVRTSPVQPPTRGEASVELLVRDATTGAPVPGLALDVVPWMPAMGHGASVTPSVSETAPGTYVVSSVDMFMPGTWELRTNIGSPITDHVAPSFQIP
jgi:hypothetical protein